MPHLALLLLSEEGRVMLSLTVISVSPLVIIMEMLCFSSLYNTESPINEKGCSVGFTHNFIGFELFGPPSQEKL